MFAFKSMSVIRAIFSATLTVLFCSRRTLCASIKPLRWRNPCGEGSPTGIYVLPTPPSSSPNMHTPDEVNLIISDISAMCEIARERARFLKMRILSERLTLSEDDDFIQEELYPHHLAGFPEIVVSADATVGETFLRDYERFSRAAVFLEQLSIEEKRYQYEEFSDNISMVEEALYSSLCYIESGIYGQGLAIESNVTRDVMVDTDKNIRYKPGRYMRDYVIIKDVEALTKSVKTDYQNLTVYNLEINNPLSENGLD